jgi:hypothetical protein
MSDGSIATACWFASHRPGKDAILDEWGPLTPSTSIVWDESSGTLLNIDTPDDIDRNSEELELRMALLSQHVYSAIHFAAIDKVITTDILGRNCRPTSKTLMCTSADGLC